MSNNKANIGKTAKDMFENFESQPSGEVWTNIEQAIDKLHTAKRHRTSQFVVAIVVVAIIALVGTFNFYYSQNEEQTIASANNIDIINNKPLAQNIISATETQYNDKSTESILNNQNNTKDQVSTTNTKISEWEYQLQNTAVLADNTDNFSETDINIDNNDTYNKTDNNIDNTTLATAEERIEIDKDIITNCSMDESRQGEINNIADVSSNIDNNNNVEASTDTDKKGVIYIPSAFTPDRMENNRFFVKGKNIKEYEIRIMSKAKVVVYSSNDINEQWDGTHNGEAMEMGTYIYMIVFTDFNNEVHHKNGTLILIRQK